MMALLRTPIHSHYSWTTLIKNNVATKNDDRIATIGYSTIYLQGVNAGIHVSVADTVASNALLQLLAGSSAVGQRVNV
jgi:hypothetical protein